MTVISLQEEDKTITTMGISEAVSAKESKIDMTDLRKEIGIAPTEFHGYLSESEENVIILSGLTMPYSRVDAMTESIQKKRTLSKIRKRLQQRLGQERTLIFSLPQQWNRRYLQQISQRD